MARLLVLVFFVVAAAAQPPAPEPRRPNILLLFADDQRTDSIGAFGNQAARTPALDALVARGFAFRANYCLGWQAQLDDPHPLRVAAPTSKAIDLSGRARKADAWQPAWIVEKYFDAESAGRKRR